MKLERIEGADTIRVVAGWMAERENYKWLGFGNGHQSLTTATLKVMTQRDIHVLRIFTSDADDVPIGAVALSNVDPMFKTATLWFVLGDKEYSGRGYTTRAVSNILMFGFTQLGLQAVNAWTVETNIASRHVLERNNFQYVGRQRQCHYIDDQPFDRLLFDLLAHEHNEGKHVRPHAAP
jgi:RimJ/RimL family protein N-acetyltransferase